MFSRFLVIVLDSLVIVLNFLVLVLNSLMVLSITDRLFLALNSMAVFLSLVDYIVLYCTTADRRREGRKRAAEKEKGERRTEREEEGGRREEGEGEKEEEKK